MICSMKSPGFSRAGTELLSASASSPQPGSGASEDLLELPVQIPNREKGGRVGSQGSSLSGWQQGGKATTTLLPLAMTGFRFGGI